MSAIWKGLREWPRVACNHHATVLSSIHICGVHIRRICVECLYETLFADIRYLRDICLFAPEYLYLICPREHHVYRKVRNYCKWCDDPFPGGNCGPPKFCRKYDEVVYERGSQFRYDIATSLYWARDAFTFLYALIGTDMYAIVMGYYNWRNEVELVREFRRWGQEKYGTMHNYDEYPVKRQYQWIGGIWQRRSRCHRKVH